MKNIKRLISRFKKACFGLCIFILPLSLATASDLVSVNWLEARLTQSDIVIVDLRDHDSYSAGHIPSAINLPLASITRNKNDIPGFVETPKHFKKIIENLGINNQDTLVLYGDWSFLDSMRAYWVFDFYGHTRSKVLDGGYQSWLSKKPSQVSKEVLPREKSNYMVEIQPEVITTKFRTFMASKSDEFVIIDGRAQTQFNGEKSLTKRKGRIPNAINLPWFDLIDNRELDDKYDHLKTPSTLKDIEALKSRLSIIPKDKNIILYCNGGQESSVIYFSLKELGIHSSVYDGSWFEWSADEKMPVE